MRSYSPPHTNYAKALKNWHAKEEYLTKELVKFKKYEDVLIAAGEGKGGSSYHES